MKYILSTVLAFIMIACGSGAGGSSSDSTATANGDGTGVGGSMARFTISGDFLYTLNSRALQSFDISIPEAPLVFRDTHNVSFDVETLFAYGDNLYVGGESGMYIYDKNLTQVGSVSHFKSCDPVVVQNDVAYVTLNTGNSCRLQEGRNELQVFDVKDPTTPTLIHTQEEYMYAPTGLGIDGDKLFVCDGSEGLKVFDVNQTENNETNASIITMNFNRASSVADINCYDVIPYNNLLIVSNGEDVRQFDYSHLPMIEHK